MTGEDVFLWLCTATVAFPIVTTVIFALKGRRHGDKWEGQ